MAQIGKPQRVVTNIPKPVLMPQVQPLVQPVEVPAEERELVPVRRQPVTK